MFYYYFEFEKRTISSAFISMFQKIKNTHMNLQPLLKTQGNSSELFLNGVAPLFAKIEFPSKVRKCIFAT